jgi:hypothetical protein
MLFINHLNRAKLVNARVIDQNVNGAERLSRRVKKRSDLRSLGDIALHGHGFAPSRYDGIHSILRVGGTAGVVHYDGGPIGGQALGYAGANSLPAARNNRYFAF